MAGVKVTDLTTLGTAASDDVLYIVDTSSNTSKQIEVQNIYDGMPQFASGIYTPVVTNETNLTVDVPESYYSRVGNIVTVSFFMRVTLDAGETSGSFELEPPIASTSFSSKGFYGTMWYRDPSKLIDESTASFPGIDGKIAVKITSPTSGFDYQYLNITGQYYID